VNNTSCQQLSVANASNSTTDQFTVADGFTPTASGTVNSICWNGVYLPAVNITDNFTVTDYDCDEVDNPGVPSAVIASFSQSGGTLVHNPATQKINTGLTLGGIAEIFEYHATHADVPVQAGERYFVEIVNTAAAGESWFWEFSSDQDGDGASFQKPAGITDYARWSRQTTDVAFCLNIELGDQTDVCPLPLAQPCELDISGADVEENEPCANDPDLNLACSADPPEAFTELGGDLSADPANPTVIHGQAWAELGALPGQDRDIDFYRFTVPGGVDSNGDGMVFACLALASELPMQGNVAELTGGLCPATLPALDAVGFDCGSTLAVGYEIPLGTPAILIRTADAGEELFDGFPCGGGTPCPEDCGDGNGTVATADLLALLGQWGEAGNCDLDGSGTVSTSDLLQLLGAWGPCPSPFGNDYLYEIAFADTFEECFPAVPVNTPIVVKTKKGAGRLVVEFND
jgi:hypothetical protein